LITLVAALITPASGEPRRQRRIAIVSSRHTLDTLSGSEKQTLSIQTQALYLTVRNNIHLKEGISSNYFAFLPLSLLSDSVLLKTI
jgi:hypothetical protein